MIEVYVKNQYIEFIEKEIATTNSVNYFKIHFLFDESWDKYVRHVTFFSTQKGERYVMQIKESNTVYVPNEVLKDNLPVYFGLYGENADGIRITTNTLQIPLINSAYAPNSTIVDEDFVELRDFVKTEPDKIQYIREKDGVFEYSLDGIRWTQVRGKQGLGLPSGGEVGQYLVKSSINNYETIWKSFDKNVDANSENGVSSKAVAEFVNDTINNYDEEIKSFIGENNKEIKTLISQEDDKVKEFVTEKETQLKALISQGDNEVKQIVSDNYNELKTEQAKAIESIKVSTANNTTELTKTNKQVVIDLTPFLSHLEIGDIKKDVVNNSLRITPYEFKTEIERIIPTATDANNGFMSKEDKLHLDTLYRILDETSNDADSFVDTISEILDIFSQYPEGADLLNALSQKVDNTTFNTAIQGINVELSNKVNKDGNKVLSTNDFTDKYKAQVDNSVDKTIFNDNIQTLANQVGKKVDKVVGKGLSTNDYTDEEKQKLNNKVDKVDGKQLSQNDFDNFYKDKVNNSVTNTQLDSTLSNYLQKTRRINGQELSKDLNVSVDKGNWQSRATYYVGDMVSYGQLVWVCTTSHQLFDQFDKNYWKILSYHNEPNIGTELGLFTYEEKQKLTNIQEIPLSKIQELFT